MKTRTVDAGFLSKAPAMRVGRLENDPPQFGQRPPSFDSTQVVQNVHSKEQIQASFESGGRSVLQHSQPGRICSMSGSYREGRQLSRGITPAVSCAGAKRRVPTGGACWRQLDQTVRLGSGGSLLHLISPMFLLIAVHNQHPKAQPLK